MTKCYSWLIDQNGAMFIFLTFGINNINVENVMVVKLPSPSEVHIGSSDNSSRLSLIYQFPTKSQRKKGEIARYKLRCLSSEYFTCSISNI